MLNKIGIYSAITSFIIGTVMFLIFYFTNYGDMVMTPGIIFVIVAGIVNAVILLGILKKLICEKENRKKKLITSAIILLNIPIAIIYLRFVMIKLGEVMAEF